MLDVIGAGYSRTGTLSLKHALEILGTGPCYHFTELLKRRHVSRWLAVLDGATPDWDALFMGYSATVDWPGVTYYRELAAFYPDAKVILTVRDPEQWHASLKDALLPLRRVLPFWIPWASRIARLTDVTIWEGTFKGRADDRDFAIACYQRHLREVCAEIDEERLLVYNVGEGWEPLCNFLGRPIPDIPFPRTNSRRNLQAAVWAIQGMKWLILTIPILIAVAIFAQAMS